MRAARSSGQDGRVTGNEDRPRGRVELVARLRAALGERPGAAGSAVDASARRRAEYSSDASNYRVPPAVVVFPREIDDIAAVAEVCRVTGTPLTTRGAGTSIAGNAVGPGVVVDVSRHLDRIVALDPAERTATVQPGVVLDRLQAAAGRHGLRFGPDPSTHARCTLGGMIGNNACGSRAIAYGRTADNVLSLDVLDGAGRRWRVGAGERNEILGLDAFVRANLATLRTELGRFGRQVSGYSLEHLLPERGADLARALVGTEGTCVVVLGATVRLVAPPSATAMVVLGYPDMPAAADAVVPLRAHGPLAMEGMDARLVDIVRRHRGAGAVPALPAGNGWLFVEVGGDTPQQALAAGRALAADAGTAAVRVLATGPESRALWRIREDGAGLAGRTADGEPAWPGWEDAAVPPERLGAYLRDFEELLRVHRLAGVPYGHFGDGCVHVRLDLPLGAAPGRLRAFLGEAADLVAAHGGSLSGEHGDGRARSELLPRMYSPAAIAAFAGFKHLFDPADLLNPGVLVRPRPVDADLRLPAAGPLPLAGGFAFATDRGDFGRAVHRCVGLGTCRADTSAAGGFMCPSFLATRDEKDSTRGRARVLQEMANGTLVRGGPAAREVTEALDLCLSCKACAHDCAAGVDMATYKSEVLYRAHRRRIRPIGHYVLGWLPRWARLAGRAPALVNAVLSRPATRRALLRLGGMDPRRDVPAFAVEPFSRWWRQAALRRDGGGRDVVLWIDSFTESFSPEVGRAAVEVLSAAGYRVIVPPGPLCCGLTWITTGQLDGARRRLRATVAGLAPYARAGTPIVGLEPSCTAVLRGDLTGLLPDDPAAALVAGGVRTLAELLAATPGWAPPRLDGVRVLAQPHCHQHAVMGFTADRDLLSAAGARLEVLAGCCGLAGNFGMEAGHYDVSVAIAERGIGRAAAAAPADAVLLADGFSCRTQAAHVTTRRGRHLAELLAAPPSVAPGPQSPRPSQPDAAGSAQV
ncbi:FAD-binding protein [Candidatus Frankia alpina]|uniref:FAD-binding protein n=1 Tax=Candidatus Frankia alpina TaxID=2699483 RepID=A0A4S5EQC0_9ACTN|nr:FAD-binding protein [Candidatus Frankia alpina]